MRTYLNYRNGSTNQECLNHSRSGGSTGRCFKISFYLLVDLYRWRFSLWDRLCHGETKEKMTFQEALKYMILAPFQPKQTFQKIGSEGAFDNSNIKYLLAAEIFWYFGILLLFPYRYFEFENYITLIYLIVPILFSTFGMSIALQAVSNFTLKNRISSRFSVGLVAMSLFPLILSVPAMALLPINMNFLHYGFQIWIAIIVAQGISTLRFIDLSKGLATSVIAVILVMIVSNVFFNQFFLAMM